MKNALVTGANKGLGLEFVRQLKNKDIMLLDVAVIHPKLRA